jgi:hypothetical protein
MARLEIRDPDDKTIATVRVSPDGLIEMEPANPAWEAELKSLNVVDPRGDEPVVVTPADGDDWLYGLQINYRGIYARGVYIDE